MTSDATPWLERALRELRAGVRETPGPAAHPRIVMYDAATTLKATSDEIPWCAAFVSWCLEASGIPSTKSAAASSYLTWGEPSLPRLGAIAVFRRVGGHHVAFFLAQIAEYVVVLGGNQSNAVTFTALPGAMLLDLRWPILR